MQVCPASPIREIFTAPSHFLPADKACTRTNPGDMPIRRVRAGTSIGKSDQLEMLPSPDCQPIKSRLTSRAGSFVCCTHPLIFLVRRSVIGQLAKRAHVFRRMAQRGGVRRISPMAALAGLLQSG